MPDFSAAEADLIVGIDKLVARCHGDSVKAGWWGATYEGAGKPTDIREIETETRFGKALVAQKLCLIHSEISEAMEGFRKGLMDDKLPHRKMIEVELVDALVRIADLAGAMNLDLGGALIDKLLFNAQRPDHKLEARAATGGKAF